MLDKVILMCGATQESKHSVLRSSKLLGFRRQSSCGAFQAQDNKPEYLPLLDKEVGSAWFQVDIIYHPTGMNVPDKYIYKGRSKNIYTLPTKKSLSWTFLTGILEISKLSAN